MEESGSTLESVASAGEELARRTGHDDFRIGKSTVSLIQKKGRWSSLPRLISFAVGCGRPIADFLSCLGANNEEICACSRQVPKDKRERRLITKALSIIRSGSRSDLQALEWVLSKASTTEGAVPSTGNGKPKGFESDHIIYINHDAPQPVEYARFPYFNKIPASPPAEMNPEEHLWIDIVHSKAKPGQYVLRVEGKSMEPELRDGDLILMEFNKEPLEGDIVAALIDGESTLKEFFREGKKIRLHPLNELFDDIVVPGKSVRIQGVYVETVRTKRGKRGRKPKA